MDVIKLGKLDRFENSRPDLWREIQEMAEQTGRAEAAHDERWLLRKLWSARAVQAFRRAA